MNPPLKKTMRALLTVIAVCFLLGGGCSKKIVNDSTGGLSIIISSRLTSSQAPEQYGDILLTITGPEIDVPLDFELTLVNGYIYGEIQVPIGRERFFDLRVYDTLGTLIYRGQTMVDIETDGPMELDISLTPQVPMLRLSPHFIRSAQGTFVKIDVLVYNIFRLNRIDLDLLYEYYQLYPKKVDLNQNADSTIEMEYIRSSGFSLSIWNNESNGTIVDDSGFGRLATITFYTYVPGTSLEEVNLDIRPLFLLRNNGDSIPVSSIHNDMTTIELFNIFDYMVAYWRMNDNADDIVLDISGNHLNGTASGTSLVKGAIGTARSFNGVSDYIEIPDNNVLDLSDGITMSFWVKIGKNEADATLLCKSIGLTEINYMVEYTRSGVSGGDILYFRFGSAAGNRYEVPVDFRDNAWHHVAVAHQFGDPETIACVVDGKAVGGEWSSGGTTWATSTNTSPLYLGRRSGDVPNYFKGTLDEVFLLNTALDPETLVQLYYGPTAKIIVP
nr:LamG domain-containing protein [candidate division Zixibacteria bacterium]